MSEHSSGTVSVPYQVEFIEKFLQGGSNAHHLLVAPPGAGKTHTACTIIERMAESGQLNHVLILAPAPLRAYWVSMLATTALRVPVVSLDRQKFRELQASVPVGQSPWSNVAIVVANWELFRHADVFEAVTGQQWDLIVVDEYHRIRVVADPRLGINIDGSAVLQQLIEQKKVHRLLMMTATPTTRNFSMHDLVVTQWQMEPVPVQAQEILYTPGEDETRFINALNRFLDNELVGETAQMVRDNVRQHAESSVFSVEPALLWMMDEIAGSISRIAGPAGSESEGAFHALLAPMPWRDRKAAGESVQALLSLLDEVTTDSKLGVLLNAVEEQRRLFVGREAVCIVALYKRTAAYLYSALVDAGVAVLAATSYSDEERLSTIDEFRTRRGCLIITYSGLKGVEIPDTRTAIIYDDLTPASLEQVIGRFNRYGRQESLTVVRMRRKAAKPVRL